MIDGEVIWTTREHPFYLGNGQWVSAGDLQDGDFIRNANWQLGKVQDVTTIYQTRPMYNLSVDTAHTYFVGEQQWLVHNSCFNAEDLLTATRLMDRGGLTKGGRALQKHANRASSLWRSYLPSGTLNPANYNAYANELIMDIVTDPSTTYRTRNHASYGTIHEYFAPDGRGLRFDANGNFIGFLN